MVVTFCGHRDFGYNLQVIENLHTKIEKLILKGADTFYFGGYGNFDNASALVVRNLKSKYPHIKSILVIPYINKDYDKNIYDSSVYPPLENVPKRYAIIKRNEWMVDKSHVVVACVNRRFGGAYKTMVFAEKKHKYIIKI